MAIYDHKEFLTLDDVADYLRDEGVYDFSPLDNYTYPKIKDFILGLINEDKLQAVFFYHGYVIGLIDDWFSYVDSPYFDPCEPYTYKANTNLYKGYFVASQKMLNDWQNDRVINYIQSVCNDEDNGYYYAMDLKGYRAYNNPKGYALTSPPTSHINLLYPKSQLDAIFNPSEKDDHASTAELHARIAELESEITAKDERIAELEKQANDKKLDKRTENNLIRLLLVVNEWAKTNKDRNLIDTSKPYNKNDLEKINSTLDLLGYHQIGETAYKTLIELIKSKKSKGL